MRMKVPFGGFSFFYPKKNTGKKRNKSLIYENNVGVQYATELSNKLIKPRKVKIVITIKRQSSVYALFFFCPSKPLYMKVKQTITKAA